MSAKFNYIFILPLFLISDFAVGQVVTIGTGTNESVFTPLCRTRDYCAHEMIFLSSQINVSGTISKFAFNKHDGTNLDSIENVVIYMKPTAQTTLASGNFDTTGYTRVFTGSFPNNLYSGWLEVTLDQPYSYSTSSHLQILCVKGYQPSLANDSTRPRWLYSSYSPIRARRYFDNTPVTSSTVLDANAFTGNARLDFGPVGVVELGDSDFSVYPNPSSGDVNFTIPADATLQLSDLTGKELFRIKGSENKSIKGLSSGMYIYTIVRGKDISSGKIVVE